MTFFYTVKIGDTPQSIARKHNLDDADVLKANRGAMPFDVGQTIRLPNPPAPDKPLWFEGLPEPLYSIGATASLGYELGKSVFRFVANPRDSGISQMFFPRLRSTFPAARTSAPGLSFLQSTFPSATKAPPYVSPAQALAAFQAALVRPSVSQPVQALPEPGAPPAPPSNAGFRGWTKTDRGWRLEGEDGQYAEKDKNIRGNKWRVVTEKDEQGNWVKRTISTRRR